MQSWQKGEYMFYFRELVLTSSTTDKFGLCLDVLVIARWKLHTRYKCDPTLLTNNGYDNSNTSLAWKVKQIWPHDNVRI
jgi:hypothetical protein